jgi:DivIVA domain-containing protein
VLWFWVVVLVALIGAIAVVAAGRGDAMSEVYDDRPDAALPKGRPLNAEDLRSLRLTTGVRGYRMDEVDALLARLEVEMIDREDQERVRGVEADEVWDTDLDEGYQDEATSDAEPVSSNADQSASAATGSDPTDRASEPPHPDEPTT